MSTCWEEQEARFLFKMFMGCVTGVFGVFFFSNSISYVWVFSLNVCLCTFCMLGTQGGQKKVLRGCGTGLDVSYHVKWRPSGTAASALTC